MVKHTETDNTKGQSDNIQEALGEASVSTLADVLGSGGSVVREFVVLTGENLGNLTLKMCLPLKNFIDCSQVGNQSTVRENEAFKEQFVAQRPLMMEHAKGLARYTLLGLVHSQINRLHRAGKTIPDEINALRDGIGVSPYTSLQPIVVNIRDCKPGGEDITFEEIKGAGPGVGKVSLAGNQILWVVDGQHRREGFNLLLSYLDAIRRTYKYPKKGLYVPTGGADTVMSPNVQDFWTAVHDLSLQECTVSVEVHLGLNIEEEQQLFHDLNNLGKKVSSSLAYSFDHTDPINMFIKDELVGGEKLDFQLVDHDQKDWHQDDGAMLRKDMVQICALLFLGKTSTKSATPELVKARSEYAKRFWQIVQSIEDFGEPGAKTKTVAAQPVVVKALAKLANELSFGHAGIRDEESLKKVYSAIIDREIDFSHINPMWQLLFKETSERNANNPGIKDYVHVPAGTNLDAGTFDPDQNWVRFGSRSNDIIPRLGDIIRWKLGLDPRPSVTRSISKEEIANEVDEVFEKNPETEPAVA